MNDDHAVQVISTNAALRRAVAAHLASSGRTATTAATMAERRPGPATIVTTVADCSFADCAEAAGEGARVFVLMARPDHDLERHYAKAGAAGCVVMDLHAPSLATIIGRPAAWPAGTTSHEGAAR